MSVVKKKKSKHVLAFAHKSRTMFNKDVLLPQSGKWKLDGQLPVI